MSRSRPELNGTLTGFKGQVGDQTCRDCYGLVYGDGVARRISYVSEDILL